MSATDLLIWGIVLHLIADWIFQNEWMALNKGHLVHPAAWIHGGIHALAMALIFPVPLALAIAAIHILVDTRKPVQWWQRIYHQTTTGPYAIPVAIWLDQVVHMAVIAIFALIVSRISG